MPDLDALAAGIGTLAMFCLMAWALAELGDYLEANEDALRNRYDR